MTMLKQIPGIRFEAVRQRTARSPLRSDIAGFAGQTRRGPLDQLVRVEGWRDYEREFGGLDTRAPMSYAIYGYFENGGQIAHVHRIPEDDVTGRFSAKWLVEGPIAIPFQNAKLGNSGPLAVIRAASPGRWSHQASVSIQYQRLVNRAIRLEWTVKTRQGELERLRVVIGAGEFNSDRRFGWTFLEQFLRQNSRLIDIAAPSTPVFGWNESAVSEYRWSDLILRDDLGPPEPTSAIEQYQLAMTRLMDEPEIALVAFPDLEERFATDPATGASFLKTCSEAAARTQDRMVIVDRGWMIDPGSLADAASRHAVAVYSPRLKVVNGNQSDELVTVSATGHVAGVMSRVDRDRGAHYTPANVLLLDAVDLAPSEIDEAVELQSIPEYVNQIRCVPGRGLMVWGGRTLDSQPERCFIAHRRLLHRLVRAIRRVAEPIVFNVNGPELWRMLTRAVTSVLLEAFRGGALAGVRADEAFYVQCDETTNSHTARESGRVECEIGLAMAAPMEFITIRVTLGQEGHLEVFES